MPGANVSSKSTELKGGCRWVRRQEGFRGKAARRKGSLDSRKTASVREMQRMERGTDREGRETQRQQTKLTRTWTASGMSDSEQVLTPPCAQGGPGGTLSFF